MMKGSSRQFNTFAICFAIAFTLFIFLTPWNHSSISHPLSLLPSTISSKHHEPRWMIGIFLSPDRVARRQIIRSTWAVRGKNSDYVYKFVIGSYKTTPWAELIEAELRDHDDIVVLEDIPIDDARSANHIKAMEFYNYLQRQERATGKRYDFVSKVDDDNWLNILPFYNAFIAPRLRGGDKYRKNALTVIGRPMNWGKEFTYTSGRMYTISWAALEFLAPNYVPHFDYEELHLAEDMIPEYYFWKNQLEHEFVPVEVVQAWDIGLEHLVTYDTMLIHCIKLDARLMEISTIFDKQGRWNGKLINGLTNFNRSMTEVIDRLGKPSDEELESLIVGWDEYRGSSIKPGFQPESRNTLDWKLIRQKISVEDRVMLGNKFPLNLPGNNESTGVVPQPL